MTIDQFAQSADDKMSNAIRHYKYAVSRFLAGIRFTPHNLVP